MNESDENNKKGRSKGLPLTALALIVLLIPVCYIPYVVDRRDEIDDHRRVALDLAARRVESILANAVETVENLPEWTPDSDKEVEAHLRRLRYHYITHERIVKKEADESGGLTRDPAGLVVFTESKVATRRKYRVRLDRVFDESSTGEVFDYLFLADDEGRVIHQSPGDSAEMAKQGLRFQNIKELPGRDKEDEKASLSELLGTSRLTPVRLLGRDYEVFSQPIPIRHRKAVEGQSAADGEVMLVGGVVGVTRSWREAMLVSPWVMLLLVLLIVCAILPWPLLKLALMHRRERCQFIDAYLILLSAAATLMLSTALIADACTYWGERQTEELLKKLSKQVENRMLEELSSMATQLASLDTQLPESDVQASTKAAPFIRTELKLERVESQEGDQVISLPDGSYNLKHAFWTGSNGDEFAKVTTRRATTPMVNLRKRRYFQNTLDGHTWAMPALDRSEIFVETIRSLTTGEYETVLARRSRHQKTLNDSDSVVVVAAVSEEVPWPQLIVPPVGCGFAVFDATGNILYHSDERRAQEERIQDELDSALRLRAAMLSETDRFFLGDYLTRPHYLYIRPLAEFREAGWFVITFRDAEVLGAVNTEAMLSTIIWSSGHLLVLVVLPSVVLILILGRHIPWLWPDPRRRNRYRNLTFFYLALAVVLAVLVHYSERWLLLLVCSGIPAVALIALLRCFCSRQRRIPARNGDFLQWYVLSTTILWMIVAVLPALGYFCYSWHQKVDYLLRYEQLHYKKTLAEREAAIEDAFSETPDSEQYIKPLIKKLKCDPLADYRPSGGRSNGEGPNDFTRHVQRYAPVYGRYSSTLHYQYEDREFAERAGLPVKLGWLFAIPLAVLVVPVSLLGTRYSSRRLFLGMISRIRDDSELPEDSDASSEAELSERGGQLRRHSQKTRLWKWLSGQTQDERWEWAEKHVDDKHRYYRELWSHYDRDERLVLMQFAHEHFVNPKQASVVRHLLIKGVLQRDPELRFKDSGFEAWVTKCPDQERLDEWETESRWGWHQLRWILGGGAFLIVTFLYVTQRPVLDATTTVVTGVLAAVPLIFRFADFIGVSLPGAGEK